MRVTRPHRRGFPCCGQSSCTYMPTPLPRRDRWVHLSLLPHTTTAFPEKLPGRLSRIGLSRPAQRSLTFRPACSLNRPRRSVPSEASTDLLPPPPLRLLPAGATRRRVGIAPTENRRLCTAHSFLTPRDCITDTRVLRDHERRLAWLVRRKRSARDGETA